MSYRRGPIAWMAKNPVAANLLMLVVMLAGLLSTFTLKKEVFPTIPTETILITVPYPGSSPEEVEEGILLKIEEAIQGMEGIKKILSEASEGLGRVTVVMEPGTDIPEALNKVTIRVNGIASFPAESERPIIEELLHRGHVINVSLHGNLTERQLKILADEVREDMLKLPGISQIDLAGTRDYEIAIEISDERLRQYKLSFDTVVNEVRQKSINLPGGNLRTTGGTITLRSQGQSYTGADYANIHLVTRPDGTKLKLGDIANIRDAFEDKPLLSRFNGQPAVLLKIYSIGDQNALKISEAVKQYVTEKNNRLPENVSLSTWRDRALVLKGRIQLLLKNAAQGGLLVLIALAMFLRLTLAFWVVLGVPFCFLGALLVMGFQGIDISINVLSVFGFILVLGIVVDDAIVTGESAYTMLEQENNGTDSIIRGVQRVSTATIFGIITTILAFIPTLMLTSGMGRFLAHIGVVVIASLVFSLIETKLILPAHLRHLSLKKPKTKQNFLARWQDATDRGLKRFISHYYQPALRAALKFRYITLALFIASFIVVLSLVPAGIVRYVFFPDIPSDYIQIKLSLPESSPYQLTHDYARHIEQAAFSVNKRYRQETGEDRDVITALDIISDKDNEAQISAGLIPSESRQISSVTMAKWWREEIGTLSGIKELSFDAKAGPDGVADIDIQLESDNLEELRSVASRIQEKLRSYPGILDVRDTFGSGAPELDIRIKPEGEVLGLGQAELARQIRQAFFGAEIQRIQRGRHELRVYARLPKGDRSSLATLRSMWINLPNGEQIPFETVAEAVPNSGISTIHRVDRKRVVNVKADVDKATVEPGQVVQTLKETILPQALIDFPSVSYQFAGSIEDQAEDTENMKLGGLLVLALIYAALAIPLKSYGQPLYIMSAIPFAVVGAILGHLFFGMSLSFFSIIGVIALAGVVVNDSLVLVDYVNQHVAEGMNRLEAVVRAGQSRFRAVILTSATTFLGLLPIQLETSIQAQFLKPMAISVGFGVLFATFVTLFLVPILFFISQDIRHLLKPAIPAAPELAE